jgi:hypothetical protein
MTRDRRRCAAGLLAAVLVVVGSIVACSGGDDDAQPRRAAPASSTTSTTPTTVIDYSTVLLRGVPGSTTSTIRERGEASIGGVVTGPDGPVGGATVRIERFVGDVVRRTDVATGPDGRFGLANLPGGRYRVRAFQPPSFAQVEPELFFLPGRDDRRLDLRVERFGGLQTAVAVAPSPPLLGGLFSVVVRLSERAVDGEGVVRSVPQGGRRVELSNPARWRLESEAVQTSDGAGQVTYVLECESTGAVRLAVRVSEAVDGAGQPLNAIALNVPDCLDPKTTTTAAPPPPTTAN